MKQQATNIFASQDNQCTCMYHYVSVSNSGDIAEGYQVFYFRRAALTATAEEDRVRQFMQKGRC